MKIIGDIQCFEFGVFVELFELDVIEIGVDWLCFYGYMQVGLIWW